MKTTYPKNGNPICPFDKKECTPNNLGFMALDGYLDCHHCERCHNSDKDNNDVRATGGMPFLGYLFTKIKSLFK